MSGLFLTCKETIFLCKVMSGQLFFMERN